MSQSSELGTSFGDLNTGGNLSESSFLEALFGLELGHANFADDADFLLCCLLVPPISRNSTDFCPMRAGISLVTCRFLVISLVVSRKKRIFAAELNV